MPTPLALKNLSNNIRLMVDDASVLLRATAALCEPIHDALDTGIGSWHEVGPRLFQHPAGFPHQRTSIIRAVTFEHLAAADLGQWRLASNSQSNARIALTDGIYTVVVRHAARAVIPAPNQTATARAYYRQQPLWDSNEISGVNLLLLWAEEDQVARVRLVRPIGAWSYGSPAKVDILVDFPRAAYDLENLADTFTPDDSDIVLFADDDIADTGNADG